MFRPPRLVPSSTMLPLRRAWSPPAPLVTWIVPTVPLRSRPFWNSVTLLAVCEPKAKALTPRRCPGDGRGAGVGRIAQVNGEVAALGREAAGPAHGERRTQRAGKQGRPVALQDAIVKDQVAGRGQSAGVVGLQDAAVDRGGAGVGVPAAEDRQSRGRSAHGAHGDRAAAGEHAAEGGPGQRKVHGGRRTLGGHQDDRARAAQRRQVGLGDRGTEEQALGGVDDHLRVWWPACWPC